ncbi:MAG: ABC-type multidrug transport system, ATPase and permease component [Caulobacteraceae bacterium]|nr:ABC-type multidrug transport system, ATPase and permease component [Caulobacteraceae bacterium]
MSDEHDDEDDGTPRTLSNLQVLGFVARRWMSQPGRFAMLTGLFLVSTACEVSIPWAAGALIDAVSAPERIARAGWIAWASLSAVYLIFFTARMTAFRIMNRFSSLAMQTLVADGFTAVQKFSADWHASAFAGATVRKVSRAMWGFDAVTDAILLSLMPTVIVLVGLTVSIGVRWPAAGLLAGAVVAAFIVFNLAVSKYYIRPVNLVSNRLDTAIGGSLADAISNNAVVKSFGSEAREEARFSEVAASWQRAVQKTWGRFNNVGIASYVLQLILQAGTTGLLVWAWANGRATPGDVAFGITSFMMMQGYLRSFNEMTRNLQRGLDDTLDVAQFVRTPPQLADAPGAAAFGGLLGEIVFDRVTFGYANQGGPLYRDFSLRIRPGERIALVGATGAGKSTFVKLLQRLYDVQSGAIFIDGQDIAQVTQGSLRRAIAVVPQDPALFHRSIGENIAYARPDATREEIALAARRARAQDFIAALPAGYDTLVGERGVKLSGGERQRVAIARAFLADAPILVLDEATSSLDVETERKVQEATEELMAGRTTIVIAHRLSTIRNADRILVFENGRVVEEGRHRDLVASGGVYARLHAVAEGAA